MNPRERLVNALTGKEVDRLPFMECEKAPITTYRRWLKQGGLSEDVDANVFFGFDCADICEARPGYEILPVASWACPEY